MGKRRTCILHIGTHKTGTTAIQDTLFAHRDLLLDHDIEYFGFSPNHSIAAACFIEDVTNFVPVIAAGFETDSEKASFVERLRDRLTHDIRKSPASTFVLSGEIFSLMEKEEVAALRAFLSDRFDDVRVICYVRAPVSYASSTAQQQVKGGALLHDLVTLHWPSALTPQYRSRIEKFFDEFGRSNVEVLAFDRDLMINRNVVSDFVTRVLGLPDLSQDIEPMESGRGLDHGAVLALDQLNGQVPLMKDGTLNKARDMNILEALERHNKGRRFVLEGMDWEAFDDAVSADVDWLAEVSGGEINFGESETRPSETQLHPEDFLSIVLALNDASVDANRKNQEVADALKVMRNQVNSVSLVNNFYREYLRLVKSGGDVHGLVDLVVGASDYSFAVDAAAILTDGGHRDAGNEILEKAKNFAPADSRSVPQHDQQPRNDLSKQVEELSEQIEDAKEEFNARHSPVEAHPSRVVRMLVPIAPFFPDWVKRPFRRWLM